MTKLYASNNSEFFAVREPGRLYLYRDNYLDLTHRVNDQMAGDFIHLADNGDCFFRSPEGLFRLRREKGARAERCRAVASIDGSPEGGTLRGFAVRADGEQVAYEHVVPAQKFSNKLKRFLGQKSAQGAVGPSLHRFVVSRWSGRDSSCYYETIIDPRLSSGLVWWTSPDFGFLAVVERERDGRTSMSLIDVLDESVVSELVVSGRLLRGRKLTSNGSVGFGLEKKGRRAFIIWTYSQDRYQVSYPKESRVLHLTKDKVIFVADRGQRLVIKDYDNKPLTEVSLAPLAKLGVRYTLNFNPRGGVELVTYHNGKFRVHHTDLESLPIDAKRWELLGERRRAEKLEQEADQILQREEVKRAAQEEVEQRAVLADQMELIAPRQPNPVPEVLTLESSGGDTLEEPPKGSTAPAPAHNFESRAEAKAALEKLQMRYVAGELGRDEYHNEKAFFEGVLASLPEEEPDSDPDAPPRILSLSLDD